MFFFLCGSVIKYAFASTKSPKEFKATIHVGYRGIVVYWYSSELKKLIFFLFQRCLCSQVCVSYWFNSLFLFFSFSKGSFDCSKRTPVSFQLIHSMLPPPFTCYWTNVSPVTQPCHLVELWRFNSFLVNRNLPDSYLPHLGKCLPCNIPLRSHLFFTCWEQHNTNQVCTSPNIGWWRNVNLLSSFSYKFKRL